MRRFNRILLGFASALALAGASVSATAGDITYPSLGAQTTVQDTDLIATWRSSGPLLKLNASVLATYVLTKGNSTYLQVSSNLSDVASASTARTNLGLGTAATQNTGTSGATLCLLNANCTKSGTMTFGAKPFMFTSTTGGASFNVPNGVAPSSPVTGDIWAQSGVPHYYDGATNQTLAFLSSSITGSAAKLTTARVISLTGDVTATCPSFDGSAAISCATTGVQAAKWTTARTITLGTDLTGSVSIDGSAGVTLNGTVVAASTSTAGKVALATNAQTVTGADTTHAVTPASAAAAYACQTFSIGTLSLGATGFVTHTLGVVPTRMSFEIVNGTPNAGYSSGDVVAVGLHADNAGSSAFQAYAPGGSTTTVDWITASGAIAVLNPSTGNNNAITAADWAGKLTLCP